MCDVRSVWDSLGVSDRQGGGGGGGGEVREILQSIEWQMCRCGRGKKGGGRGGGVMLIKATHLQPIKEPLSFIKANLLKHAARDVQTTALHTHSDSLFLYLPVQWTVPGPVIPSGMLKDAFGREKGAELPAETSVHGRYIDRDLFCSWQGLFDCQSHCDILLHGIMN